MRYIYATFIVVVLLAVSLNVLGQEGQIGNIKVMMTGFKNDNGKAYVALVNSKQGFDAEDMKPYMGGVVAIKGGESQWTFKGVPYGTYAVKFFHDENGNGKLDTGAFGIPKEEYGFSNNISSKSFNRAKFELSSPDMSITIKAR